jgi:hypothetical protein
MLDIPLSGENLMDYSCWGVAILPNIKTGEVED